MPLDPKADLHARIDHDFSHHAPNPDPRKQIESIFADLREDAKDFAHIVIDFTPPCREQSLALTYIEQGLMYAIAAVARHQEDI